MKRANLLLKQNIDEEKKKAIMNGHQNIISFLQNNIIDFPINTITFQEGDEHIVAEVNSNWIFRFAKTESVQQRMTIEVELLTYLNTKIDVCSIPYVMYYFPQAHCFGYKKIIGDTLSKELYQSLSDNQQNKLANDIAQFLYEFHTSIPIETAKNIGLIFADWPLSPEDFKKNNLNIKDNERLNTLFETIVKEYRYILETMPHRIVHNDIHEKNILIDSSTKKLSGIIDFTSASIGVIYHEFRYLHLIDQSLLIAVIQAYSEKSQSQLSLRYTYIFCLASEFSRLTEKSQFSNDYKQIIQRIYELGQLL